VDSWGWSALHRAIQYDRVEMIKLLITRGADCQLSDSYGKRRIHRTAFYGSICTLHKLVIDEKVPICIKDSIGNTPLHDAAIFGRRDIIEFLLWHGFAQHTEDKIVLASLY